EAGRVLTVHGEDHRGHLPLAVVRGNFRDGRLSISVDFEIARRGSGELVADRRMTLRGNFRVSVDVDSDELREVQRTFRHGKSALSFKRRPTPRAPSPRRAPASFAESRA